MDGRDKHTLLGLDAGATCGRRKVAQQTSRPICAFSYSCPPCVRTLHQRRLILQRAAPRLPLQHTLTIRWDATQERSEQQHNAAAQNNNSAYPSAPFATASLAILAPPAASRAPRVDHLAPALLYCPPRESACFGSTLSSYNTAPLRPPQLFAPSSPVQTCSRSPLATQPSLRPSTSPRSTTSTP